MSRFSHLRQEISSFSGEPWLSRWKLHSVTRTGSVCMLGVLGCRFCQTASFIVTPERSSEISTRAHRLPACSALDTDHAAYLFIHCGLVRPQTIVIAKICPSSTKKPVLLLMDNMTPFKNSSRHFQPKELRNFVCACINTSLYTYLCICLYYYLAFKKTTS